MKEERYLQPSEVCKILGISYITFYRYIRECSSCKKYVGNSNTEKACACEEPKIRLKAVNIGNKSTEWRVSSVELSKFLRKKVKDGRFKGNQ